MSQKKLTQQQLDYVVSLFDSCEIEDLKKLTLAEEIQLFAFYHNRSGGEKAFRWIIENPKCDKGTALMVYWRAEPLYLYKEYASTEEVESNDLDVYETSKEIEKRIQSDFYKKHDFKYDPKEEEYLLEGFILQELKQTIPSKMFDFNHGKIWENPLDMGDF